MTVEYFIETFRVKRLHNIRDFAYKLDLSPEVSAADLALLLNSLTEDAFFWSKNNILHSTSEVNWPELLPEEVKSYIKGYEKVREGYLEESNLPYYATFALFAADFNRVLSPNFKANPLFKRLRRRTKEGWNLSLWMKFLHEFSINYKFKEEDYEYQIWRWFAVKPEREGFLTFAIKGGIEINGNLEEFFQYFDGETLKRSFVFRVRGSYRIGRLREITPEGLFKLVFDGEIESSVPKDKVIPIFLADSFGWKEKDRSGLLKHLRLTPKVLCKYRELLAEAVDKLLEPYMVKLSFEPLRWDEVKVSPFVVVDKPVPEKEVIDYIFEEKKVYNTPFDRLEVNFVDLVLKSEKNKKLLKDSKQDFIENLTGFLKDVGVETSVNELIFDKKLKKWNLKTIQPVLEFLKGHLENLKKVNFNLIVVPQPENLSEIIKVIPVWNVIKKTLKGTKTFLITDRSLKVFFKSQKLETKRKILFEVLVELFRANGGSLFILDEPLSFGRVIVETEDGYEIYNIFGELLDVVETVEVGEEDLLVSYSGLKNENTVRLEKYYAPAAVKRNLEENRCLNAEKGISFNLGKKGSYLVLSEEIPFGYKPANGVRVGENLNLKEVEETLLKLSKVRKL